MPVIVLTSEEPSRAAQPLPSDTISIFRLRLFGGGISWRIKQPPLVEIVEYQGLRMTKEAAEIAEREGIDVWLLKENLEKTPLQRFRENQGALDLVLALEKAREKLRDGTQFGQNTQDSLTI